MDAVNSLLGMEFIPKCAVGEQLSFVEGNLILRSFSMDGLQGWRRLDGRGDIVNAIASGLKI